MINIDRESAIFIFFFVLLLAAGVFKVIDAIKYPERISDYYRERYQKQMDSISIRSKAEILNDLDDDISFRRRTLDNLGLEITQLRHNKDQTKDEILNIIERLKSGGLFARSRNRYLLNLVISFLLGVTTSILGNLIWAHVVK